MAGKYGTPLFVYDEDHLRSRCREYTAAFSARHTDTEIIYASKAFNCVAMCQIAAQEGLGLDVSTAGELHTAIKAGVPGDKLYLHGNNKSPAELEMALDYGVGRIIVDSLDELHLLEELASARKVTAKIYLRITPGIKVYTHEFLETGGESVKFGFVLADGVAREAMAAAIKSPSLELMGIHSHIGSQIFALHSYARAVKIVFDFLAEIRSQLGWVAPEVNLGGGLGIGYQADDAPSSVDELADIILNEVKSECARRVYPLPKIMVEPGRSIVGNAAVTLYTVGTIKEIPHIKKFVCVDGGMSDNLRTSMYGAVYEALLANNPGDADEHCVCVAGKHCETGDVVVKEAMLPPVQTGDILVTPATGAYGYSMANNYNRQPRPAVVLAKNGQCREIIRRESLDDLTARDLSL